MDKSPPPALFKPSPWGPTPLVKGRCRAATEGIGKGAPVRTLGRMRGQSEEQVSLEELCRAGARPRRPVPLLSSRRTREGELPRRGKRSWPGPRLGAPFRKGFALRGEFLFHVEKEPMAQATLSWPFGPIHLEDARGSAQDGHSVSIFAHPLEPPLRGTRTCRGKQNFRRAKSEWLLSFHSGPPGPGFPKIEAGAIPHRRLALPSR